MDDKHFEDMLASMPPGVRILVHSEFQMRLAFRAGWAAAETNGTVPPKQHRPNMSKKPDTKLLAYTADQTSCTPDELLAAVSPSRPAFPDRHLLGEAILALWPQLSAEGRLLAYLLACERAEEANRRWDRE